MRDFIALAAVMIWPAVPLFWIPVHGFPGFFKRLGYGTYILPVFTWLPLAFLIYRYRFVLLSHRYELPAALNIAGIILLAAGTLLHLWTGRLLGLRGLIGVPELASRGKGRLVIEGPFSVVRHPTYLAHTLMLLGVFLYTGVTAAGIITALDALVVNAVIIPLEDRELLTRFGEGYKRYRVKVPGFIPRISRL